MGLADLSFEDLRRFLPESLPLCLAFFLAVFSLSLWRLRAFFSSLL